MTHRVPKSHTCSLLIEDRLWFASGKEIRIFRPNASNDATFDVLETPITQPQLGPITSGCVIGTQLDRVYFGHTDGKVSVYSISDYACLNVVHLNIYKITALAGAGSHLWAAFSIGMIYVYDTTTRPWETKKGWLPHQGYSVLGLSLDRSSLWRTGVLRLASMGADNVLRFWDGTLQNDWLGKVTYHSESTSNLIFLQIVTFVCTTRNTALLAMSRC